jgi:hypothetical protein
MSFHPGIPWRVALQQSSPPLPRTLRSCLTTSPRWYKITPNGEVRSFSVSHPKGSPHEKINHLVWLIGVYPRSSAARSLFSGTAKWHGGAGVLMRAACRRMPQASTQRRRAACCSWDAATMAACSTSEPRKWCRKSAPRRRLVACRGELFSLTHPLPFVTARYRTGFAEPRPQEAVLTSGCDGPLEWQAAEKRVRMRAAD